MGKSSGGGGGGGKGKAVGGGGDSADKKTTGSAGGHTLSDNEKNTALDGVKKFLDNEKRSGRIDDVDMGRAKAAFDSGLKNGDYLGYIPTKDGGRETARVEGNKIVNYKEINGTKTKLRETEITKEVYTQALQAKALKEGRVINKRSSGNMR